MKSKWIDKFGYFKDSLTLREERILTREQSWAVAKRRLRQVGCGYLIYNKITPKLP